MTCTAHVCCARGIKNFPSKDPGLARGISPLFTGRADRCGDRGGRKYTNAPSIVNFKFKDTPVTLNRGTENGLLRGMELTVAKPDNVAESVTIVRERPHSSEAIMTQMGKEIPGPRVGSRRFDESAWLSQAANAQKGWRRVERQVTFFAAGQAITGQSIQRQIEASKRKWR